ncbi:MAG: peptidyl-prolyl cis-trans isomerase [Phycisphaerales bacterium]|nr:peptidyl-prolyl cis-trans isomerase [Phycisphaerales bacterium]
MKRSLRLYLHAFENTFCKRFLPIATIAGLAISSGCTSNKIAGNREDNPTPINIADFRADPNEPVLPETEIASQESDEESNADPSSGSDPSTDGFAQRIDSDTPSTSVSAPILSGTDGFEFLDAKVGDISGHPIYVSSFFEPIKDRLIASANQKDLRGWRNDAIDIVKNRLDGIIYDELLRAETIAALTPKQRVGLQSFLSDFRSNILSENLGSAQLANQRILENQGITLDEALRQKELDTLVGLTLYQEINQRINISWRDIKQRYERDIDRFQPPPTVVLQVIRVLEPEGELVDSITQRLNEGEDFAEIASSEINTFNNDTQGIIEVQIEDEFGSTEFFAPEPLNEAVWSLKQGDWTGPVSLGNANFWILYADRIQDSKTLYEAQIQLKRELETERREIERAEFLTDLIERARVSSRDEILLRLLYIAEQQYGPKS